MNQVKGLFTKTFAVFIFLTLISSQDFLYAQSSNGEALFKANCASCHKPDKQYVGPALKGARDREPSKGWHYEWIRNATAMAMTDPYAKKLKDQMGGVVMTSFPDLSNSDIDAILDYADNFKEPGSGTTTGAPGAVSSVNTTPSSDNTVLYGLLTLILAVIGLVLLQVNSNLKKLTDDKDGIKSPPNVPFYRNKTYLLLITIILFVFAGYWLVEGAMGLGRQQGYQPNQPIYFVHQVHAGVNQISCLYCHGGAQDSRHATIPAVNVCMNCHMAVKEYAGAPITREDGTTVDANAEIQKLYQYAGWNPDTKTYDKPGKPIEWVQIHNLPDFVYFNHSQHVTVGGIECQTCHGPVETMEIMSQFAPLTMGWCITCHRETDVKVENNEYYTKIHEQLSKKYGVEKLTVAQMGGLECGKCHY